MRGVGRGPSPHRPSKCRGRGRRKQTGPRRTRLGGPQPRSDVSPGSDEVTPEGPGDGEAQKDESCDRVFGDLYSEDLSGWI